MGKKTHTIHVDNLVVTLLPIIGNHLNEPNQGIGNKEEGFNFR